MIVHPNTVEHTTLTNWINTYCNDLVYTDGLYDIQKKIYATNNRGYTVYDRTGKLIFIIDDLGGIYNMSGNWPPMPRYLDAPNVIDKMLDFLDSIYN